MAASGTYTDIAPQHYGSAPKDFAGAEVGVTGRTHRLSTVDRPLSMKMSMNRCRRAAPAYLEILERSPGGVGSGLTNRPPESGAQAGILPRAPSNSGL